LKPVPGATSLSKLSALPERSFHLLIYKGDIDNIDEYLPLLHIEGFLIIHTDAHSEIDVQGFGRCVEHTFDKERIIMLKKVSMF
jgi:hypothetical protein